MSQGENRFWQVKLEQNEGRLAVQKELRPGSYALKALQVDSIHPATLVQLPVQATLAVALVYDHGQLPPGITPLVGELDSIAGSTNKSLSVMWVCLGYVIAKDWLESPSETAQDVMSNSGNGTQQDNGDFITSPQKRYLYRLLAKQQIKGVGADAYLKNALHVDDINSAEKTKASKLIDWLVNEGGEER